MKEVKKDSVYLKHILECVNNILNYTKDVSDKEFFSNKMMKDAVVRNFEIIGEATKRISLKTRDKYKNVEWRKMSGIRDKLIHDYLEIDYKVIWFTVTDILQNLKTDIEEIIKIEEEIENQ